MTVTKVSSVVLSEIIATNNECNNESAEIYLVLIIWNVISCSVVPLTILSFSVIF